MKTWICFFLSLSCFAQFNYSNFDFFQNFYTKSEIQERLKNYLQKDDGVSKFYELSNESFKLLDENKNEIYQLLLAQDTFDIPFEKKRAPLRVALDPGHLGGLYSRLEGRHFHQLPTIENNLRDDLVVKEGEVNLYTALALKKKLEAIGVEVFMTRSEIGVSSFGVTFEQWLENHFEEYVQKQIKDLSEEEKKEKKLQYYLLNGQDKFDIFSTEDLYHRAEVVNQYKPDVAISLHYNSCGVKLADNRYIPSKDNFTMVFTGGSFEGAYMDRESHRYNLMRLLLTEDHAISVKLAKAVVKGFVKNLKVPIVDPSLHIAPYLKSFSIKQDEGVYARSLAFVREVEAPAILGEPTCADNPFEGLELDSLVVNEDSARIQAVAQSYFEGIVEAFGL